MSRYSGRYAKGESKRVREQKRTEAEERNARTPSDRRRAYRQGDPATRLLTDIFAKAAS
jgi:hypothetical protein